MDVLWFIVIGLIAGALAGRVVSGHGYGVAGDIVVGVIGASSRGDGADGCARGIDQGPIAGWRHLQP